MSNPSTDPALPAHPPAGARDAASPAENEAPLFPTMENIPDLRRDAVEEAAETSSDARARVADMNAQEAAADPTLERPGSDTI